MCEKRTRPTLKANIAFNFTYQLLILALPLITAPYLSRVIGAEGVGTYSYSYSIALYFTYFVKLGLDNYGNREIARCGEDREKRSRVFWALYCLQAICFLISFLAYVMYSIIIADNSFVAALQGIFVVSALFDINWLFFGLEQFHLTVIRNVIIKVITTVLIFMFVRDTNDVLAYITVMCCGYLFSQLSLWPYLRRFVDTYRPSISEVAKHLKPNLVLFGSVIVSSVYGIMSKVLLGSISGEAEVGYYDSAFRIIQVPIALVTAVGSVMLPRMSSLVGFGHREEASSLTLHTLAINMFFTCCAGFGIPIIAAPFTELFYGPGFARAIPCMIILSAVIPILGFENVIATQVLLPYGYDRLCVISSICGAIVSICFNLLLVPAFGAIGAACSYVVAELVVLICQFLGVRHEVPSLQFLAVSIIPISAGGIMAMAINQFFPIRAVAFVDMIVVVITGLLIYCPTYLLMFYIYKKIVAKN